MIVVAIQSPDLVDRVLFGPFMGVALQVSSGNSRGRNEAFHSTIELFCTLEGGYPQWPDIM